MAKTASRALSFPSIRALMHCACRSDPIIAADLAELDAAVVWVRRGNRSTSAISASIKEFRAAAHPRRRRERAREPTDDVARKVM